MASAEFASSSRRDDGFSLVEALVAVVLLALVSVGVAQLFALGTTANFRAKLQTSTAILAAQKMEQLRALRWGYDDQGLPISDVDTDLSQPQPAGGGAGLNPSPGGTLAANVAGYFDLLDVHGAPVATPATAAYIRRWSIQPLPTNPNNTLIFQVRVIPRLQITVADGGNRASEEVTIFSVKTRKAS